METETQTFEQAMQTQPAVPAPTAVPTPTTQQLKMVPESDLIAVKKGFEKQLEDLKLSTTAELATVKQQSDTNYQGMLRESASKEELERQVTELTTKVTGLADAEKQVKEATDSRDFLSNQIVDLKKTVLTSTYPTVTMESLEGKSLQELNTLEEALKLVGGKPAASNYDAAGGGGSGTLTGNEGLRAALEEAKKR